MFQEPIDIQVHVPAEIIRTTIPSFLVCLMDRFYFLNIDLNFFRLWSRFLLKMMWVLRVITFRALGGRKVEEIEYTYNHPDVAFVPGTSNGLFLFFKY